MIKIKGAPSAPFYNLNRSYTKGTKVSVNGRKFEAIKDIEQYHSPFLYPQLWRELTTERTVSGKALL